MGLLHNTSNFNNKVMLFILKTIFSNYLDITWMLARSKYILLIYIDTSQIIIFLFHLSCSAGIVSTIVNTKNMKQLLTLIWTLGIKILRPQKSIHLIE